ncbi:hypothetical protein HZB96_05485 [Candidatus Gottesmanbacteria bacterium]|nr:hypothetical protein [Candidatus Gottesmanbacteria bacterium]
MFGGNLYITAGFITGILLLSAYFWRKLNISEKLYILQIVLVVVFSVFFVRQMITHYAISSFVPLILLSAALFYRLKGYIRKWFSAAAIIIVVIFLFINFQSYGLAENHGWTMAKGWNLPGVEKWRC